MSRFTNRLVGALALMATLGLDTARAHEGHDHSAPLVVAVDAAPRGEASSALFELVAIAQGEELVFYVDRFATNEPVDDAAIEVETPAGPAAAVPSGGAYRLKAPWLARPGRTDLIATVTAGSDTDVLPITIDIPGGAPAAAEARGLWARTLAMLQPAMGVAAGFGFFAGIVTMSIRRRSRKAAMALLAAAALVSLETASAHEGHDHDAKPAQPGSNRAVRGADGVVFVPKPIQRIFGVRTIVAEAGSHPRVIELPGRIIPDPNASGFVQTAIGGRLSPPPGGFPRLGTPVKAGDVLALVTPPMQQIDVSDMRQRQGELDQQIAIVEKRQQRYERLAPSGAIAAIQLEETRLELEGLRERRAQLDKVRREPEALIAPVSGVIADGTPVAGQIAQPNAVVFHIVDPGKLWIEALSFDAVTEPRHASAQIAGGRSLPVVYRGSGWADRNQSVAVQFEIEGERGGLRAGQFVTVHLASNEEKKGVAIPRASVIRNANGQDVVYVHVTPERFEAKPVRVEPLDGERVLVLAGIEPGARVAVQGAELLDHVR